MRAIPMLLVCLIGVLLLIGAGCTKPPEEPEQLVVEPPPTPEVSGYAEPAEPGPSEEEATEAPEEAPSQTEAPETKEAPVESAEWTTTETGLRYKDVKAGDGPSPEPGDMVVVHYTGTLSDGTKFDSSRDRGTPFSFSIGRGEVIEGWDEGVMSMKVNGKRELIIPAELGYGETGTPGGPIPPNAELHFEVELLEVK